MQLKINKIFNYFILVVSISIFSCKPIGDNQNIRLNNNNIVYLSDVFSSVKCIQLETTSKSGIGQIAKIIYYNSNYYILDIKHHEILCYNESGKFRHKISFRGKGPGEYIHIADFAIDKKTERILVLDASSQKVLFYNFKGKHLFTTAINSAIPKGYNSILPLNDSIILLNSITDTQIALFNYEKSQLLKEFFQCPANIHLQALSPRNNIFQFDNRTFVLPALSSNLYEITDLTPVKYFEWDFGKDNNSKKMIKNLIDDINTRSGELAYRDLTQLVGKGKHLNHHITLVYENSRYRIALVEFEGKQIHVINDKKIPKTYTFECFYEGVILNPFGFTEDRVITFSSFDSFLSELPPNHSHRLTKTFNRNILTQKEQKIIDNHDEFRQNPFLVVYKFKE